jgi:hypothetical protein
MKRQASRQSAMATLGHFCAGDKETQDVPNDELLPAGAAARVMIA